MRLAAIDIGSNAARLLIVELKQDGATPQFNKLTLLRVPLRLGFDVFAKGNISRDKTIMILHMMDAFKSLMDLYKVDAVRACATSAMRNAKNSGHIIQRIREKNGIKVEIISGREEAELLYQSHAAEKIDKRQTYLYVNVGGGSTELNLFVNGKPKQELSFEVGSIRLLKNTVKQSQWDDLKNEVREMTKTHTISAIIGTGGNINKLFSLTKSKDGKPLNIKLVQTYYRKLSTLTTAERIKQFKMGEDRADVIVPALDIYLSIMQWSKVNTIYVPKIGLVDGIVYSLYHSLKARKCS